MAPLMSARWSRLLAVLGLVLLGGLVAAPASADPAPVPPWGTTATYTSPGGSTGWSSSLHYGYLTDTGRRFALFVGEPYATGSPVGTSVTFPFRVTTSGVPWKTGDPQYFYLVQYNVICQNKSTLAYKEVTGSSRSSSVSADGAAAYNLLSSASCGTGWAQMGAAFYLNISVSPGGTVWSAPRMVWYADTEQEAVNGGKAPDTWCYATFGPDYTKDTTVVVSGVEMKASDYGCMGDILTDPGGGYDPNTDFAVVCADAPEAEWLSFGWLDDWIGHYAGCLFAPKGGINTVPASTALEASFLGPVKATFDAIGAVDLPSGGCGVVYSVAISAFGERPISLDTCQSPWNGFTPVRNVLGVGFLVLAGVVCISMVLKAIGFDATEGVRYR